MYSPQVIHLLQEATRRGDYKLFKEYTALVDDASKPHTLRGLMEMQYLDLSLIHIEMCIRDSWRCP